MNTSRSRASICWDVGNVDDEVADLAPENSNRFVRQRALVGILVAVNDTESSEVCCSLEQWGTVWIADELSVVVVNNRL